MKPESMQPSISLIAEQPPISPLHASLVVVFQDTIIGGDRLERIPFNHRQSHCPHVFNNVC